MSLFVGPPSMIATTISPTIAGFGTVSQSGFWFTQFGKVVHIYGSFKAGTVAASTASIDVSSLFTIDSTKYPNTAVMQVGWWQQVRTAAGPTAGKMWTVFYDGSDTAKVYLNDTSTGSNVFTKENGNALINSSDSVTIDFWITVL
jgi:hypothetical protein